MKRVEQNAITVTLSTSFEDSGYAYSETQSHLAFLNINNIDGYEAVYRQILMERSGNNGHIRQTSMHMFD